MGRGDRRNANKAVNTSITVALILGLFMAVAGFLSVDAILKLMAIPDNIIEAAAIYLRIYFLGTPFLMLYNFCAAVFRSNGCTKIPMVCLVLGGVLKLTANFVFVVI